MGAKREARVFLGTSGVLDLFVPLCPEPAANTGHGAIPPLTPCIGVRAPAVDITGKLHLIAEPPHLPIAAWSHAALTRPAWLLHHPPEPANDAPGAVPLAPPRAGAAWGSGPEPLVAGLDRSTRQALGEAWLASALEEHASVAAFAQLALALLSFGAPADLMARTEHAAMQEVDHARLCFVLASTYLGTPLGPGPLPVGPIMRPDAIELALASWRDGCLGDGAAAAVARAARRRAHDPAVCAALTIISRDEAAHAELAWDVLSLCLDRGGREVADALREAVARTPRVPEDPPEDEHRGALTALLAEHGHLSAADRARCAAEATRTAVRRAGWLLAPGTRSRPGPINARA